KPGWPAGSGGSVGGPERQPDFEQGALAAAALDADRASVYGHDFLDHEQPDARPRMGLGGARIHHEELLEDPIVELGADADSIVADSQNDLVAIRFQPDVALATGRGELHRVLHEGEG